MLNFSLWALLPPIYSVCTAAGLWAVDNRPRELRLWVMWFVGLNNQISDVALWMRMTREPCSTSQNGFFCACLVWIFSYQNYCLKAKKDAQRIYFTKCIITALPYWYFIAVYNKNITPLGSEYRRRNGSLYPPYISIAGNYPPASCIFGELMNLAAFAGFFIAVFRYLQLKDKIDKPWLNICSLVVLSIGFFGMTIVGNFQLFTEENIHNVGAIMVFGLGTLFCWLQSYITLRVNLKNEGKKAAIARFLLSGSITLCLILYFSLMSQSLHMYASRCQWALVMVFLIFISTFAIEFRHSSFSILCTDTPGYPFHRSEMSEVPM